MSNGDAEMAVNLDPVLAGLRGMRLAAQPADKFVIESAMLELGRLPLPRAYLSGLKDELMQMVLGQDISFTRYAASVYLGFYGEDGRASYLKIGLAKDVTARLASHGTSNPLSLLWAYTAGFDIRAQAQAVEGALLGHMAGDKIHGEWVRMPGLSEEGARAVADSLAEVACAIHRGPVKFRLARI